MNLSEKFSESAIQASLFYRPTIEQFIDQVSEDIEKLKGKILPCAQLVETYPPIKDENPYKLSSICNYECTPEVLLGKRKFLMGMVSGINNKVVSNKSKSSESIADINVGVSVVVPNENVKVFKNIKYEEGSKYLSPSKIVGNESLLEVDEIYPMIKKGKKIDITLFTEEITDADLSEDVGVEDANIVERCDVKFIKYLNAAKNIKVEVIFNPLCDQISFYLFVKETIEKEEGGIEEKFLCHYRSFYIVEKDADGIARKIIFRPYNNSQSDKPVPEFSKHYKSRPLKNYIKEINNVSERLFNNKKFTIESTYQEIFTPILDNRLAIDEILNLIEINETDSAKINEIFEKKKESLIKKFSLYKLKGKKKDGTPITDDEINTFEIQLKEIRLGSDSLHPTQVKNIKRFCKLDSSFKLESHREIQQKLIPRESLGTNGYSEAFNIENWIAEKMAAYEKTPHSEKDKSKYKSKMVENFRKLYNNNVLANKEYIIFEPVNFAYFRPFTLTDIINTRYKTKPMYQKLGLTNEDTPANKAIIEILFKKIEELRAFVFTFASMYYDFEKNTSSIKYGRIGGKITDKSPVTKDIKLISIPIHKIYPNQLYSNPNINNTKTNSIETKYIRYFSVYEGKNSNLYDLLSNETKPVAPIKPLTFLQLVEGIITEEERVTNYPYINPEELFQPKLEQALVLNESDPSRNKLISAEYKELTTYNVMYDVVKSIDIEDIIQSTEERETVALSSEGWNEYVRTLAMPTLCKACGMNKFRNEDDFKICTNCDERYFKDKVNGKLVSVQGNFGISEDEDETSVPVNYRTGRKDERDIEKKSGSSNLVDSIWLTHLSYLIVPEVHVGKNKGTLAGEVRVRERVVKTQKVSVNAAAIDKHINKLKKSGKMFDYHLAILLRSNETKLKNKLLEILLTKNRGDELSSENSSIHIKYFNKERNSKDVKDSIVLLLKQMDDKIDPILEEGAPDEQSINRNIGTNSSKLDGTSEEIANKIFQSIITILIKKRGATKEEDKILPEYQNIASWSLTLTRGTNGSFIWKEKERNYYQEIPKYMQTVLKNYKANEVEDKDKGIAENLISDVFSDNLEGLTRILQILDIQLIPFIDKTRESEYKVLENIKKLRTLKVLAEKSPRTLDEQNKLEKELTNLGVKSFTSADIDKKIMEMEGKKEEVKEDIVAAMERNANNAQELAETKKALIDIRQETKNTTRVQNLIKGLWRTLLSLADNDFETIKSEIIAKPFRNGELTKIETNFFPVLKSENAKRRNEEAEADKEQVKHEAKARFKKETVLRVVEEKNKDKGKDKEKKKGSNKPKRQGGGDYEKYMKYKFKYLKLKKLFNISN